MSLNGAVAAATVHGPAAGPALLESPERDARPKDHHRLFSRAAVHWKGRATGTASGLSRRGRPYAPSRSATTSPPRRARLAGSAQETSG